MADKVYICEVCGHTSDEHDLDMMAFVSISDNEDPDAQALRWRMTCKGKPRHMNSLIQAMIDEMGAKCMCVSFRLKKADAEKMRSAPSIEGRE